MEPYIGELRCFSFAKIPTGWLPCDGRTLPIQSNAALYSLLGTAYGGDGQNTFAIPDLRGSVPMHYNPNSSGPNPQTNIGAKGGVEAVTLTQNQMASHTHQVAVNPTPGTIVAPQNTPFLAALESPHFVYASPANPTVAMAADIISTTAGGASHPNMQPYTVANYCIAIAGYYPPRP